MTTYKITYTLHGFCFTCETNSIEDAYACCKMLIEEHKDIFHYQEVVLDLYKNALANLDKYPTHKFYGIMIDVELIEA